MLFLLKIPALSGLQRKIQNEFCSKLTSEFCLVGGLKNAFYAMENSTCY